MVLLHHKIVKLVDNCVEFFYLFVFTPPSWAISSYAKMLHDHPAISCPPSHSLTPLFGVVAWTTFSSSENNLLFPGVGASDQTRGPDASMGLSDANAPAVSYFFVSFSSTTILAQCSQTPSLFVTQVWVYIAANPRPPPPHTTVLAALMFSIL